MNKTIKNIILWIVSIIFMLVFIVYQRMTGPTYPVRGKAILKENTIKYKLLRSWGKDGDAEIRIEVPKRYISGKLEYRRFKSYDKWQEISMQKSDKSLIAFIPHQPPAGKVMYNIKLSDNGESIQLNKEPIVIRFTGVVPSPILWTHIILMFLAMVFAIRTLIEAFLKGNNVFIYTFVTCSLFLLGGLVLGPIVQKYAFNAYWTGWPFGHDLTDNKTLAAFILWLIALIKTWKNRQHRTWVIIAGLGLIAVYLIPHSILGSELDYTKIKK